MTTIFSANHLLLLVILLLLSLAGCGSGGTSSTDAANNQPVQFAEPNTVEPGDENLDEVSSQLNSSISNSTANSKACESGSLNAQVAFLVNQFRSLAQNCGSSGNFAATTTLSCNTVLSAAAESHSRDMATYNFFSHTSSNGLVLKDRIEATAYPAITYGENIAAGYYTAEDLVQAWLESPGHCANLMNANFKDISTVCAFDNGAYYKNYCTMVLAASQ